METCRLGTLPQLPSPLGYRVVEIAEERVPPRRRANEARSASKAPNVKDEPSVWRIVTVAGGAAVAVYALMIGFVIVVASWSVSDTTPLARVSPPVDFHEGVDPSPFLAIIPQELAGNPANAADERVDARTPTEERPCDPQEDKSGRETFGTAVEFARNPQEAGRIARVERKLAFHLHVSGNFEDTVFT